MKYILIILWESGEKEEYSYTTEAEAKEREAGYKMAFGKQISYTAIRKE